MQSARESALRVRREEYRVYEGKLREFMKVCAIYTIILLCIIICVRTCFVLIRNMYVKFFCNFWRLEKVTIIYKVYIIETLFFLNIKGLRR